MQTRLYLNTSSPTVNFWFYDKARKNNYIIQSDFLYNTNLFQSDIPVIK